MESPAIRASIALPSARACAMKRAEATHGNPVMLFYDLAETKSAFDIRIDMDGLLTW
jgi:hypothetical protein